MILCFICTYTLQMAAQTWIGTWATAPQTVVKAFMPYNNNMTNRSVRQIVKVSVGGDVIRLKLSNIYSMQPVVIRSIYIAHAKDSFKIDAKSAQYFKFSNSYKATIPAGRQIVSDALKFNLKNLERVAITINYTSAPDVPTVHMGSRTTSYIMKGVTNAHSNFEKAFRENHWYNISGIDVYTMSTNMSAIAIMGNSITDGKCSTDNAQNRWPDVMSEMLQLKHKITNQGVLNLGIGNNRVTVPGGFGGPPDYREHTGNDEEGEGPEDESLPRHHHAFQGCRLLQPLPRSSPTLCKRLDSKSGKESRWHSRLRQAASRSE